MITITGHGHGEIAFGALQAGLDLEYSRSSIGFTWEGFDEMDEVSGDGSAELLDDGTIEIEFAYRNGDEAVLKAKRATFFNSLLVALIVQRASASKTRRSRVASVTRRLRCSR